MRKYLFNKSVEIKECYNTQIEKCKNILQDKSGASVMEIAVYAIIALVLGGMLLKGFGISVTEVILPGITSYLSDLFSYGS